MSYIQCSFCHTDHVYLEKIFAGPNDIYVCDNCIELLYEMLIQIKMEENNKISRFEDRSKMF